MFPQIDSAPNETVREYIIHGGTHGGLSREQWIGEINKGLDFVNEQLLQRVPGVGSVDKTWDAQFLQTLTAGDLKAFDEWVDADVLRRAGNGAGEIRQWITAASAAQAVEARPSGGGLLRSGHPHRGWLPWSCTPEHCAMSSRPILLLHGAGGSYQSTFVDTGWVEAVEAAGRTPLGVNLPGHASPAASKRPGDYADMTGLLLPALPQARLTPSDSHWARSSCWNSRFGRPSGWAA